MCSRMTVLNLLVCIVLSEILLLFVLSIKQNMSTDEDDMLQKNFEELYAIGTRSYLDNNWDNCIKYIEKSIEKYKKYQRSMSRCKMKCSEMAKSFKSKFPDNIEDLHFYEKMLKTTLCLLKTCDHLKLDINKDVLKAFNERDPYEYVQLCYYKVEINKCYHC